MFDISNGCGSCSTYGMNEVPVNQVMQVDQTSQYLANMVANNVSNGNGMVNNNGAVNNANNRVAISNVATANNNQAVANAAIAAANNSNNNGNNVANNVANNKPVVTTAPVEPVVQPTPAKKSKGVEYGINYFLMVGLAVAAALAFNETAKYHINQAIKFNEGSPMYYIAYTGVMVLLAGVVHHYLSKN